MISLEGDAIGLGQVLHDKPAEGLQEKIESPITYIGTESPAQILVSPEADMLVVKSTDTITVSVHAESTVTT